jgi:hypothetical protein
MTLYRIPKGNLKADQYTSIPAFAFEFDGFLFFTTKTAAAQLSEDITEIHPTQNP